MKRILSTLVLLAFVLVDAAPCRAAFTSCGMKMPVQNERCGECLADAAAGPVLAAASCCRVEAGTDRSTTPAVLFGNAAGSDTPGKVTPAPAPTPSAATAGVVRAALPDHTTGLGPPLPATRSTILRL
jgi:hypothetical protein